jgi:hypothetical protein
MGLKPPKRGIADDPLGLDGEGSREKVSDLMQYTVRESCRVRVNVASQHVRAL